MHYPELGTGPVSYEDSISPEFYDLERDAIFRRAWLNVGRVEQLPRRGSNFTREIAIANTSLILVRGMDDEIRAFHNICRHRGNKLVWQDYPRAETRGNCRQFVCKYHGWKYELDGSCSFVQQEGEFFGLDRTDYGLVSVPCEVWAGFIRFPLNDQEILCRHLQGRGRLGRRLPAPARGGLITMGQSLLPLDFADLEPFAANWYLPTERERYAKRLGSTMDEMQAFYDAFFPLAEAAIAYCDKFPLADLPDDALNLLHLLYSLLMISFPVEAWRQPFRIPARPTSTSRSSRSRERKPDHAPGQTAGTVRPTVAILATTSRTTPPSAFCGRSRTVAPRSSPDSRPEPRSVREDGRIPARRRTGAGHRQRMDRGPGSIVPSVASSRRSRRTFRLTGTVGLG